MRLASFTRNGAASYGVVRGDRIVDLGPRLGAKCPTLRAAIAANAITAAHSAEAGDVALADVTLLPPVTDPDKIICIGLNYRAHAAEGGFKIPEFPSSFTRLTNTLVAHGKPMVRPIQSGDFDYEGELAVIIGRGGRHISAARALDHVFGYSCFNDGSIRDFQFKHSVNAGKNFHATGGFGPWILTADEVPDPTKMTLTTLLNGQQVQHKGIDDLIFSVQEIIAYVSSWTPLEPGDVIATGTPEGVGFARKPPLWMKAGDTIEIRIDPIGTLTNPIIAEG